MTRSLWQKVELALDGLAAQNLPSDSTVSTIIPRVGRLGYVLPCQCTWRLRRAPASNGWRAPMGRSLTFQWLTLLVGHTFRPR